jgi:hypothetical protein
MGGFGIHFLHLHGEIGHRYSGVTMDSQCSYRMFGGKVQASWCFLVLQI